MDIPGIKAVATAVRTFSMDAVQRAGSGHPGQPMGCAELGATLYGEALNHFPQDPDWINRDRFVLSAGHGCLLQYALLHLCGYDLSVEDIRNFRRLGSKATGHPEYGVVPGVEVTTGPLGQGIANAVGMAITERMLASRFNSKRAIIDYYTYCLVGDGDLMEGISYEAGSLAGHLGLGKLIVFYDSNGVTIEGSTGFSFTEDVRKRFLACEWQVFEGSAYDIPKIVRLIDSAKREASKPTLIIMKSIIAKGSINLAGSPKAHGSPLGEAEIRASKKAMGVPEESEFHVPREATEYLAGRRRSWEGKYRLWQETFELWSRENPGKFAEWQEFRHGPELDGLRLPHFEKGAQVPTRTAGGEMLKALAGRFANVVGGSADLSHSTSTNLEELYFFSAENPGGRSFRFGIREHAMAAIANGIAVSRLYKVFCSTYLVFSDYMRPSIRLAAMMKLPVVYVFTHDSILSGEDGPTHQPVEQLASLRAIPGLAVLRPGDAEETRVAWKMAISASGGPTALILSRQPLTVYDKADALWEETLLFGAYIVSDAAATPETVIIASGSEVNLALETKRSLAEPGVRVVSMMCRELFLKAPPALREKIVPPGTRRIVIEAGVSLGWEGIAGDSGLIVSVDSFGKSAPMKDLRIAYGLDPQAIASRIKSMERR
jgi:transketolase